MSNISVDAIRNLNKVKVYAFGLSNSPVQMDEVNSKESGYDQNGSVAIEMYSTGPMVYQSDIDVGNTMDINSIMPDSIGSLIQVFTGYAPMLDVERKYLFKGSSPMKFDIQGYLVLNSDPVVDLFKPILNLAYLTFPSRKDLLGKNSANKTIKEVFTWLEEKIDTAVDKATTRKFLDVIIGKDKKPSQYVSEKIGEVWTLKAPPVMWDLQASTPYIIIKYGGFDLKKVMLKNLKITIPTLYYEGGYPPYIEVGFTAESLRITTFDTFNDVFGVIRK